MSVCKFCDKKYQKESVVLENDHFYANFDSSPVTAGHIKIISKKHKDSFFDLTRKEVVAAYDLLKECKILLDKKYKPEAYNVGLNDGKSAGQTIFHLHIHLIPRCSGDVKDPIGGVRNVIPGKGNYLKNLE